MLGGKGDRVLRLQRHAGGAELDARGARRHQRYHRQAVEVVGHLVFGAPLRIADPTSAALSTARALATELRRLPVDFGIGVSAGPVFAGNIGAENRYEYTVVGDPVNEAARLADCAKEFDGRALCSGAAIARAESAEGDHWAPQGQTILRGRSDVTDVYVPSSTE